MALFFPLAPSPMSSSSTPATTSPGGWRYVFGCTPQALALYRISLGILLLCELLLRFRFLHPFYSDEGTLPLRFLLPKVDDLYKCVCLHCWSGELWFQQVLLSIQVVVAVCFTLGYHAQGTAAVSWFLYFSLTLRNTWLNFILDRYFHFLLWYAIFLPTDSCWSIQSSSSATTKRKNDDGLIVSLATVLLKLQVLWLYLDAGGGKWMDPLGGWTWHANIPALDSYARHTLGARYLYAILQPLGLRILTPIVVYVELLCIPVAMVASYFGKARVVCAAIVLLCGLHVGIASTLRNTVLLSLVACSVCCVFLPLGWTVLDSSDDASSDTTNGTRQQQQQNELVTNGTDNTNTTKQPSYSLVLGNILSTILLLAMVGACIWLEVFSEACDQSVKYIWSTLLHNRWNVFVGSEEYVTWEIAPGLLRNGSIVDVWGRSFDLDWRLPGGGAPCTSTARPGRWRSFPYLAGIEGEEGDVLWGYLCKEWNGQYPHEPDKHLVEFNFFMLQADVLPNMGFSATRKRLIHSHKCSSGVGSSVDGDGVVDGSTEIDSGADDSESSPHNSEL